jgi:hypothetical protein
MANGIAVAETAVPPLSENGTGLVRFDFIPTSAGSHQLEAILLADDPIAIDNHSYLTLAIAPPQQILIVGAETPPVSSRDIAALAVAPPGWSGRQRYTVRVSPPDQLNAIGSDAVILTGPRLPKPAVWQQLLDADVPIILWPDSTSSVELLNLYLHPILEHPISREMASTPTLLPPGGIDALSPREAPSLTTWFTIPAAASPLAVGPNQAPIIVLGTNQNGTPILFCGIPADPQASDLLRLRDFAPFVHRLLSTTAGSPPASHDVSCGTTATLSAPSGDHFSLLRPDQGRQPLPPVTNGLARISHTDLPGFYQLLVDDTPAATFAADLNRPPSIREPLTDEDLNAIMPDGSTWFSTAKELPLPGETGNRLLPLAPALILLFAILLPLESKIANKK